jgi:hypothetical protein
METRPISENVRDAMTTTFFTRARSPSVRPMQDGQTPARTTVSTEPSLTRARRSERRVEPSSSATAPCVFALPKSSRKGWTFSAWSSDAIAREQELQDAAVRPTSVVGRLLAMMAAAAESNRAFSIPVFSSVVSGRERDEFLGHRGSGGANHRDGESLDGRPFHSSFGTRIMESPLSRIPAVRPT